MVVGIEEDFAALVDSDVVLDPLVPFPPVSVFFGGLRVFLRHGKIQRCRHAHVDAGLEGGDGCVGRGFEDNDAEPKESRQVVFLSLMLIAEPVRSVVCPP